MSVTVTIDEAGSGDTLDRAAKLLAGIPNGLRNAAYNATKRAGDRAKTEAGRFAAEEYTITKSKFMRHTDVHSGVSGINGFEGSVASLKIRFAGYVLPLLEFNTKYSRSGELSTQVKRNGGVTTLQRAFAAAVRNKTSVFEREGSPRLPIKQLFGPSTAHMMQNEEVVKKMDETIRKTYEERMEHEISRILAGHGGLK